MSLILYLGWYLCVLENHSRANEIIISIISIAVTTVVLPLITLGGTKLIQFLNSKIKEENAKRILTSISSSVEHAVRVVF